jgi:peptidoglycan hydrolase-like protein with peptidoglycan-binding domain
MLRNGSYGHDVMALQTSLNFETKVYPVLAVDGIFGPKTETRVREFQRGFRLKPDGIVGEITQKAISGIVIKRSLQPTKTPPTIYR